MSTLLGGPLDGASVGDDGPSDICSYYDGRKGRMAHYTRRSDGNYEFVKTFDESEAEHDRSEEPAI